MNIISLNKDKQSNCFRFLAFLLFFICVYSVTGQAQVVKENLISLEVKNESVENTLNKLAKTTHLKFFYDQKVVSDAPSVSFTFNKASLQSILNEIGRQANLNFHRVNNTINVSVGKSLNKVSSNQVIHIRGTVTDPNGETVIGANVVEKGTTNGVVTDVDGKFALDVPVGAKLTVTFIGYLSQDIIVKNESQTLRVVLSEDAQKLEEVVVVGYGTMKKKDLMGATSAVSGENLAINSNISVGGSLQGKMSGISILNKGGFPGAETAIKIRGINTFGGGDSSPLVVIDGVPVSSGFETLNPNDIESVNVLKDASSAAIYGSRAANGVILITTKKGETGKTRTTFTATYGIQSPSHIMELLNASEFVSAIHEMRDNKKAIDGGNPTTKYDGLNPAEFGKGTKWSDYIYNAAPTFNIGMNVNGGNDKTRYYLSGEYLDQEGISINTGFKKASLRSNLEGKVNGNLTVGNNLHLAYRNIEGSAGNRYSDVIFNAPVIPAYDKDGTYGEPNNAWTSSKNALAEVGWQTAFNDNYRVMDNLFLEYKITDWLKFRFNGGLDMVYNEYKSFSPIYNDGGQTNNTNSYTEERKKDLMWMTDYLLYFDKQFGNHTFSALGGFSQQLFSNDNLKGIVKDFVSEVDNMQVINGGTNSTDKTLTGGKNELALASYFGRLNYDYQGKYLFSFNLRADGSSRFKGNNRWGVFPSFSGAWRISEEEFYPANTVSSLKLRASWGQLGNQSIGSWYPTIAAVGKQNVILGNGGNNQVLYAGYSQTALSNPNLKWETTTVTNLGIDAGLFNGKLFMTADFFVKNTDGILRTMILPLSVGMTSPNVNYAQVQNRGLDLELGYNGTINEFSYTISGNMSLLQNEIKKLSEGVTEEVVSIGGYGGVTINRVGEPIGALFGYRTGELITTKEQAAEYKAMGQGNAKIGRLSYQDVNKDGKINGSDRVVLGSYIPKVSAGLTLSAKWKGFDFNTVFSGVFGRKQHSPMSFQNRMPNRSMSRKWYDNRWILGTDPQGKYPALIQSESYEEMTDLMVSNTSFVKMKSLTLGYTFELKNVKTRLFLSGENLLTFTSKDFDGFDPENGDGVGHYTNWGDDYPTARIILVGLNLTF